MIVKSTMGNSCWSANVASKNAEPKQSPKKADAMASEPAIPTPWKSLRERRPNRNLQTGTAKPSSGFSISYCNGAKVEETVGLNWVGHEGHEERAENFSDRWDSQTTNKLLCQLLQKVSHRRSWKEVALGNRLQDILGHLAGNLVKKNKLHFIT